MSLVLALCVGCGGNGDSGTDPQIDSFAFIPVGVAETLQPSEYDAIIASAAGAVDVPNLAIAITDRVGNILRVWNRNPLSQPGDSDNAIAVSLARTAAFLSHSQAPLTSRTGQFISTHHFPAQFALDDYEAPAGPLVAPQRQTIGVDNTPQGPLWQINNTNRGALFADASIFDTPTATLPQLVNPDGSTPCPGLTPLPGGLPLYKTLAITMPSAGTEHVINRRLVGAIGVYVTSGGAGTDPLPEVAEYAALVGESTADSASNANAGQPFVFLPAVPPEGAVYLVGVLLPAIDQTSPPNGVHADPLGLTNGAFVDLPALTTDGAAGAVDPIGYLIGPNSSPLANSLTDVEVGSIIDAAAQAALETHAAIRLPSSAPCRMTIAITDVDGSIQGLFRMDDGTLFSVEIAITKARETLYFCNANSLDVDGPRSGLHPLSGIVPAGTAITSRTLGFLTQPFYPPGIDGAPPGPLAELVAFNATPVNFDRMGHAPAGANQSGLVLFPGSAPLYKNGVLVGALGVSGDGVEQDDLVTARAIAMAEDSLLDDGNPIELEPPPDMRCDHFSFNGVTLPYLKFPQHPDG